MADKVLIPTSKDQAINGLLHVTRDATKSQRRSTLALMIHDYPGDASSHNELYGDLEFTLAEIGLSNLRYDMYGCGHTGGNKEAFSLSGAQKDLRHVRAWAKKQGFKHFVYIGAGLGASIATLNLESDVTALALMWPVVDMKDYIEKKKADLNQTLIAEMQKADMKRAVNNIHMPVMVMQGSEDKIVSPAGTQLFKTQTNSKNAEITVFHHGEYGLPQLNHRKALFFHIGQFMAKYT